MAKSKAVATGSGVDRGEPFRMPKFGQQEPEKEEKKEEEKKEVYVSVSETEWSNKASVKDQLKKDGLWKLGAIKAGVFDLSDEDQLNKYNELLARTMPVDAPSVVLADKGYTQFFEGKFFVLVHYQEVMYKVLVKK